MDRGRNLTLSSFFRPSSLFPNLWEEVGDRLSQRSGSENSTGVTVSEDDQNIYIEAQLPGLTSNEIDVSLNQNTLWIRGEKLEEEEDRNRKYYRRASNTFFYQVDLPSQVEENSEQAQFQNGVLKINFKKIHQNQVRKIAIGGNKTK